MIANATPQSTMLTLDDEPVRRAARVDPARFIEALDGLVVIDEVQRVSELILAIKARIDRNQRPGGFLLTGSANLMNLRSIDDSLAGGPRTWLGATDKRGKRCPKRR